MNKKLKPSALFLSLLMPVLACTDGGNLFGSSPPLPGTDNAYAFGSEGGEISLVSLIFPRGDEIETVSAVDRLTGDPIRFDLVETDDRVVLTLRLSRDLIVNPHLVSNEGPGFTALLTPRHSLSTFDGLNFGDHTVFLRDHGVEWELELGETAVVLPEDYTDLWVGEMVRAARVRFQNPGEEGDFTFLVSDDCQTLVYRRGRLENKTTKVKLGENEGAACIVTPTSGTEIVSVSVTN